MTTRLLRRSFALALLLALPLGCAARADKEPAPPDVSAEVAAITKLSPIKAGEHHVMIFDGKTKSYGFSFHGRAGQSVSIYAQADKGDVDTVVYLYKLSKTTGRTTGKALAYDDDTARTDWTTNTADSSIDSFTLPDERDYAIYVHAYDAKERGNAEVWLVNDVPPSAGVLAFPGSGKGAPIPSFTFSGASELPISSDVVGLQDQATANSFVLVPARVQLDRRTLEGIVADPAKLGTFGYDMMYYAGAKPFGSSYAGYHGPATIKPITAANAVATLKTATTDPARPADSKPLVDLETQMIESMLGDGDFATSEVRLFLVHWDNADDTNAEAILAIDLVTGESRAVTYVNPP